MLERRPRARKRILTIPWESTGGECDGRISTGTLGRAGVDKSAGKTGNRSERGGGERAATSFATAIFEVTVAMLYIYRERRVREIGGGEKACNRVFFLLLGFKVFSEG